MVSKKEDVQATEEKTGFNISDFFKETKEELAKVVWPSRQQLASESLAVVVMVALSASLIYLVDNFFGWLGGQIF